MSDLSASLHPPTRRSLVGSWEILRALVQKELKVKYKRSVLGLVWSLVTPLALTGVYLFVFVYVYKDPREDRILFLLSGMFPWHFFNLSLLAATNSLVENGPLIRKVYFPRLLIPVSTVTANLVNFLIGLGLLLVLLVASGREIWLQFHWLVAAVILESLLCIGVSLTLSVWNVFFRDIRHLISILLVMLFFSTPIVYELPQVPDNFRALILANPLSPIMHLYRASLFHVTAPDLGIVALGLAEVAVLLTFGVLVFRRHAPELAKEV